MSPFIVGFVYIFLLGIQQQNITHRHHGYSFFTCYALALAFAFLVKDATTTNVWWFVFMYGTGSALGASLSMVVHGWLRERGGWSLSKNRDGVIGERIQ